MQESKSKRKGRKKPKIITRGKSYKIEDCYLFNTRTKSSLCLKLGSDIAILKSCISDSNYRVFPKTKADGTLREIQEPKPTLDHIQTRIASYLSRISLPDYLHSGRKGHSYITNAKKHVGQERVLTVDIKKYFSSTSKKSVYYFFYKTLKCSCDVAGLLAELCTYDEHVPTGSRLSMVLVYWANKLMFDKLERLCKKQGITMTLYVDDLTFSGRNVNAVFKKNIISIIESCGMSVKHEKSRMYRSSQPKVVTGVVVKNGKLFVMNKHHKLIYGAHQAMQTATNKAEIIRTRSMLKARLNAAGQIEPRFLTALKRLKTSS